MPDLLRDPMGDPYPNSVQNAHFQALAADRLNRSEGPADDEAGTTVEVGSRGCVGVAACFTVIVLACLTFLFLSAFYGL